MARFNRQHGPHPTPDALVALRNTRLWEAHAQRSSGTERDRAHRAATQWSAAHEMLMSTAPGDRPVPLRRGAREKSKVGQYIYLTAVGGMLLVLLGSVVWNLIS